MKLFAVLMFVFTCGLSASTLAQQERVNLDLKDVSLNELCSEIQRQTSLYFMFNSEQVRQLGTISVKAVGETVESVLRRVLAGTGLTFEFDGSLIVIAPAPDEDEKEGKDTPEKFTVTGTVKDVDGVTMPGVTIQVKGTTLGFVTDSEGKFDIDLPKRDSLVLIFSFVGYQKREEPVDEKTKVFLDRRDLCGNFVFRRGLHGARTDAGFAQPPQRTGGPGHHPVSAHLERARADDGKDRPRGGGGERGPARGDQHRGLEIGEPGGAVRRGLRQHVRCVFSICG